METIPLVKSRNTLTSMLKKETQREVVWLTHIIRNRNRITSEEKRAQDRMSEGLYRDVRRAAEVHRQVRKYAQEFIRPGLLMTEIGERIEDKVRLLVEENGLEAGMHNLTCSYCYLLFVQELHFPRVFLLITWLRITLPILETRLYCSTPT